jgi:hypothetical protein
VPAPPRAGERGAAVLAFGPEGALARPRGPAISHGFYPATAAITDTREGDDPSADDADSRE